ncbi:MAG: hypothetical protein Q8K32_02160 [Archangium sp.]|nr:hypothetical protein [Archangium sp.]
MKRRGYALMVVVFAFGATAIALTVFSTRLSLELNARKAESVRVQTLWLARSACTAGVTGARTVPTESGEAAITRSGTRVRVLLSASTATVDCVTHEESYTPGG